MAKIRNKRATYDYLLEKDSLLEVGLVLTGAEAKSIREKRVDLTRSLVKIVGGELYLVNANIPLEGTNKLSPTRTRKLLVHKQQIAEMLGKTKQRKLTIVPISLYTRGRLIKLEIALGKPRRKFEKKALIQERDVKRDIERELKDSLK